MSFNDEGRFTGLPNSRPPAKTPPTTLADDRRLRAVTGTRTLQPSSSSDIKQPLALMTATLYAELGGAVPNELVAEIVQAVLDERRQGVQDREAGHMMVEARQRLDRFVRARTAS